MGRIHYKKEVTLWIQTRLLVIVQLKPVLFQFWSSRPWKMSPKRWCDRKSFRTSELRGAMILFKFRRKKNPCFNQTKERTEPLIPKSLIPSTMSLQWLHRVHGIPHIFSKWLLLEIRRQLYLEHAANAEQVKFSSEILRDDFFHFVHVLSCCSVWKLFVFVRFRRHASCAQHVSLWNSDAWQCHFKKNAQTPCFDRVDSGITENSVF